MGRRRRGLNFLKGGGETVPEGHWAENTGQPWRVMDYSFDIDNDGTVDHVQSNAEENNVLDGEFFVLVPPTGPSAEAIEKLAADIGDPDRFIAELQRRRIAAYSGVATVYRYADRVHIFPIIVSGATYLWAIGESDTILGALYRPGKQGKRRRRSS